MPATPARAIVTDVLGPKMTRELWTGNYDKALPIAVQGFDLSAVLPAVFYMFRFGHRRGKGKFIETFGPQEGTPKQRRQAATIERIADTLTQNSDKFEGFEDEIGKAILGDLLLCFCLENVKHALGRKEQIQRVAPAHYMASWVDLPDRVGHLRHVPEMIVAMLADQKGEHVQRNHDGDQTWFPVGTGYEENVLLHAFHQGIVQHGYAGDLASDQFKEETSVGVDQLLMIRLAQQLGVAPDKSRGSEGDQISNQRPIAEKAAKVFSEDIRRFVRSYTSVIPRQAFVELLESCIAVGMTTILTSTVEILFEWGEKGEICKSGEQKPARLFVDCSNGVNRRLRGLAEQSSDDLMRRLERFPIILMTLRLLDYAARHDRKIKNLGILTWPHATKWLNMLGDLLHNRHTEAGPIHYNMEHKAEELAAQLEKEDYPEAAEMLRSESQDNPVWRLAECLAFLQARSNAQGNLLSMLDSTFLSGQPNGLASKRTAVRRAPGTGQRRRRVIRSLVFTDSVLDYLVHRHTLRSGNKSGVRPFSFKEFLSTLRERYGFCVDVDPPGMTISNDLLQANRAVLERRLLDLGLLVNVNDAEAMKRLEPRFGPTAED